MSPETSVSQWIAGLKANEAEAAQKLWSRYVGRLVELAKKRLGKVPKGIADEEDIAQSVFRSVCRGAAAGRFDDVTNRDELWWLLLAITRMKVTDHIRRETAQKRGHGRVMSEGALSHNNYVRFTLDGLAGEAPTAEFLVMLDDESRRLLGQLRDDQLRRVAVCRIEGYTVAEIAAELSVSTRSVERKLKLIRKKWSEDLAGSTPSYGS